MSDTLNVTWIVLALFAYLSVREVVDGWTHWASCKYSWGDDDETVVATLVKRDDTESSDE